MSEKTKVLSSNFWSPGDAQRNARQHGNMYATSAGTMQHTLALSSMHGVAHTLIITNNSGRRLQSTIGLAMSAPCLVQSEMRWPHTPPRSCIVYTLVQYRSKSVVELLSLDGHPKVLEGSLKLTVGEHGGRGTAG